MRLTLTLDPIATCAVDAVVRATGSSPTRLSEADLLKTAGSEATSALRDLLRLIYPGGVPVGQALTTTAGLLPARHLIHVVVPTFQMRRANEHELRQAYRSVLRAADEVGATTIAMPPLGTTAPYWPLETAVRAATGVLPNTPTSVREVRLVLRTAAGIEPFAEALARR